MSFDLSLYLIAGRADCRERRLDRVVLDAVRGGVTLVQLRDKEAADDRVLADALLLRELLAPLGVPLIVNDRAEVALSAGADGVHGGQSDAAPAALRALLGPGAIIGLSTDTLEQAIAGAHQPVDYLGVGPAFPTTTKADTEPAWGVEGLERLRALIRIPWVAVGGIHAGNAAAVMRAGAGGVAVVSAICAADDVVGAAARLREAVERGRG